MPESSHSECSIQFRSRLLHPLASEHWNTGSSSSPAAQHHRRPTQVQVATLKSVGAPELASRAGCRAAVVSAPRHPTDHRRAVAQRTPWPHHVLHRRPRAPWRLRAATPPSVRPCRPAPASSHVPPLAGANHRLQQRHCSPELVVVLPHIFRPRR
ncbi:uncharacterized protein LOC123446500 [Hordeum vulgare subsp. vulgare]|uniref:uncharacterized protein LOC123446500 n=1 Tax=Hordeum vulgare subsp. vulgare TaxID=112509 RepID=UPI001D1A4E27|nr:uncharacterized protein LOC123446500 [Hordeum vulgare subsp. vulgare]